MKYLITLPIIVFFTLPHVWVVSTTTPKCVTSNGHIETTYRGTCEVAKDA